MLEIVKTILPAVLVLLTAYLLIHKLLRSDEKRRSYELHKAAASAVTPVRLRAYERLTLVLERTSPNHLVLQILKPGMTNMELQKEMLSAVREEFTHNLSQQIYVSNELWTAVVSTRESIIQLINICASQCAPTANATELGEKMIQLFAQSEQTPTQTAIGILKKEIRAFF